LVEIPGIVIGPAARAEGARVAIVTAPLEETPGCVYRLDGVPLQRRGEATQRTDAAVLADPAAAAPARVQGGAAGRDGCALRAGGSTTRATAWTARWRTSASRTAASWRVSPTTRPSSTRAA